MSRLLPRAVRSRRHRTAQPLALAGPAVAVSRKRPQRTLVAVFSGVLVVALAAQLHVATGGGSTASAAVTEQPLVAGKTLSGVVGGGGLPAVTSFGNWRGRPVDVVTSYLATNTWSAITNVAGEALTGYLAGSTVHRVWSVPMLPSDGEGNLAAEAAGSYNSKFQTVAQALVAGGDGTATIRLGWEMTGDWYKWSGQPNPSQFAAAWRQVVTAMRSVSGAHFTFDFNIAMFNADPTPMYPGDSYVDIVGADNYDDSYAWQYPASDHVQVWNYILTGPYGLNWLGNFAKAHGKRLSFPEWGVSKRCDQYSGGDDPYFIQQFHNFIASHDVAYETYSNFAENSCRNFALTSGAFPNAAALYQKLSKEGPVYTGNPTPTPTTKAPTPTPTTKAPTPAPTTSKPSTSTVPMDITEVRASVNANRTGSWALQGSTIQGNRYIFLNAPTGTTQVRFYLDRSVSSGPTSTEAWSPWDFAGGTAAAAKGWNASGVAKGKHTLIVQATLSNGTIDQATVTFTTE